MFCLEQTFFTFKQYTDFVTKTTITFYEEALYDIIKFFRRFLKEQENNHFLYLAILPHNI